MRLILLPALRRLAASLMLAALAAFVLHGGAMAGQHRHGPESIGSEPSASAAHEHPAAAGHDHGDGVHVHATRPAPDAMDAGRDGRHTKGGAEAACCGSACAVGLPALAPSTISVPITGAVIPAPLRQDGAGTEPGGLKRPPRTPSIG